MTFNIVFVSDLDILSFFKYESPKNDVFHMKLDIRALFISYYRYGIVTCKEKDVKRFDTKEFFREFISMVFQRGT